MAADQTGLGGFSPTYFGIIEANVAAAAYGDQGVASFLAPWPPDWPGRAAELRRLLLRLAEYKAYATVVYAEAFLAADGTAEARTQAAKLAAAAASLATDQARAAVEVWRLRIDTERLADLGG